MSASQQERRTQSENTSQREQELARTLRNLDNRPATNTAIASAPPTPAAPSSSSPTPGATNTTRAPTTPPPTARATAHVGTIRFNIRPWGNVTINGTNHGASPPLTNLRLAPGTYNVRIENGNFPAFTTSITVSAGQSTTLSHGFRR